MATNHTLKGACIAEFLGTGLLIFFGCGCVAAAKLAEQVQPSDFGKYLLFGGSGSLWRYTALPAYQAPT